MNVSERLNTAADRLDALRAAAVPGMTLAEAHLIATCREAAGPFAGWLRKAAVDANEQLDVFGWHVGHCGWFLRSDTAGHRCTCWDASLAVADAVLAATGGAS